VITLCSGVLHQAAAELTQRSYDLVREVVEIHMAFLDPPLLHNGGSLRVMPPHYPARPPHR
jgi:hypothetical protein